MIKNRLKKILLCFLRENYLEIMKRLKKYQDLIILNVIPIMVL